MNMYEEAAHNLDKTLKTELGDNYTTEDLLRFQMDQKLTTPKCLEEYNLKNQFIEIQKGQEGLPKEEQKSNRAIADELASKNNCSISRMYNITRDI